MIDGSIPPGARLVEADIAERMSVSRTPIREALRRLESDGFVQRRGPRLITTPVGPDDLGDIGLLRVELDGLAARLAVARGTSRDWDLAREVVDRLADIAEDDLDALAQAHANVHRAIYAMGFSPRMSLFVENHVLGYIELAQSIGSTRTTPESSYRAHLALLKVLSAGDPARAEEAAREHARVGARVSARATATRH
jgi:DNA-binding GntR family transcriptional regulator